MASNRVCNDGLKCNNRDRCIFQHPEGDDNSDQPLKPTIRIKCRDISNCKFGLKCKFDHSDDPVTSTSPNPGENRKERCKYGPTCRNKLKCKFGHSDDPAIPPSSGPIIPAPVENRKKPCRFGSDCRNKSKCEFDHSPPEINDPKLSSMVEKLMAEFQEQLRKNVPEARNQHELLLTNLRSQMVDDTAEDDNIVNSALLKEYKSQLATFDATIESLISAPAPTNNPMAKNRLNAVKREIKRLQSHLPIYAQRKELIDAVRINRVLVLKADTGSGKSTQLVQYLVDAGFADQGQIICTQPRRLAARALATRVAEEFGCQVKEEVGFHIGASSSNVSYLTKIRFVTDTILLNQYAEDPKLSSYSIVIIDEAHERRVDTDLLFGVMKLCLRQRDDIKLIVMSATLDVNLLCDYYRESCLLEVPGRTYPIEDEFADDDVEKYVEAAIAKVCEIHKSKQLGDILTFLTGPDEIDRAVETVQGLLKDAAIVLPLHGKLNENETQEVFKQTPADKRKIIFATNVAETSVTIDGIRHVIDSGMVKESMWDVKRKMQVLKIGNVTQSSVKQRRGRAGRTSPGKCYHLYTKETYESLDICPRAEILCIQPSMAVLKLKYLGVVDDVEKFEWLEAPSSDSIHDAVKSLTWLNALDSSTGRLTETGRIMAKLGILPMLSAMILQGIEKSCASHVLALAGLLTVAQTIWWRGKDADAKELADERRAHFAHDNDQGGDHIQLLKAFLEWNALETKSRSTWCRENMINGKALNMALEFARETARQLGNIKLDFTEPVFDQALVDKVLSCVSAGFFQNLVISNGSLKAGYQLAAAEKMNAQVYRSSTLTFSTKPPTYALYHEILNLNGTNCLTTMCPVELQTIPKRWLASLPRQPADRVFVSHSMASMGPTLMVACLGKRCAKKQQIEDELQVMLDVDYSKGTLTIWGQAEKMANARRVLEEMRQVAQASLVTEVEECEIVGSTRIVLGEGGHPLLVLVSDEYNKVIVRGLPNNVTEQQIENKFRTVGKVLNVNVFQRSSDGSSASVTYHKCAHACDAVVRMTQHMWEGRRINVGPAYIRTSAHTSTQSCKLRAQWFLTESECNGRLRFTQQQAAENALELLKTKFNCQGKLLVNFNKPTMKCVWPMVPHNKIAFVDFPTDADAQQVLQQRTIGSMQIEQGKEKNSSLCIKRVAVEFDEEDLKNSLPSCTKVRLIRGTKGQRFETPAGVEDDLRRLFNGYKSFDRTSVRVQPNVHNGLIEAYIQFTDECELQTVINEINGRAGLIGAGKIRISAMAPAKSTKPTTRGDEYGIDLYRLPSHVTEEHILDELKKNNLADHVAYVVVFRKKLVEEKSEAKSHIEKQQFQADLYRLMSLFYTPRTRFRSEPEVEINTATADGRVQATIIYNNPEDVGTAMKIYEDPVNAEKLKFGQHKLHLVPLNHHVITLHSALVNAIEPKIRNALETIRQMQLQNVTVNAKEKLRNEKKEMRIYIQGSDNLQMAKVRNIFNRLMKGLEFRFTDPSWVSIMFNANGKKFLQSLQERTKTYIWWNWSSTFLRIFGEDDASNQAFKEVYTFIQDTIANSKHPISIPIPQGIEISLAKCVIDNECLRQCLKKAKELKSLVDEKVSVDINIVKRLICICGEKTAAIDCEKHVRELLARFSQKTSTINTANTTTNNPECPLCCDTCEAPYVLQQCGHTYCRSCLIGYFETRFDPTLSVNSFKLCCPADGCNASCLIRDIKSILGTDGIARLAKAAFQIYLKQTGIDLAQCIGVDCQQVYRPSQNPTKYTCDQCEKIYCIACQVEEHIGLTCEENKKLLAKQRDEQLLIDNLGNLPIKKCPKCSTLIEKFAGCNAVKCTQCSIAFCWLCDYTHPIDAHGHFGDKSTICFGKTFTVSS